MTAITTGKRSADGGEKYIFAENNCAHAWHAAARQSAMAQATQRDIPRLALEPFRPESISVRGGDERVEVGEERVEVVTPVDADRDE